MRAGALLAVALLPHIFLAQVHMFRWKIRFRKTLEPGTRVFFTGVARDVISTPLMVIIDALPDVRFLPPEQKVLPERAGRRPRNECPTTELSRG